MAITDVTTEPRWALRLHSPETLADDLADHGVWVGPRTGPDKRTKGQKEDYVLRRLLVAWKLTGGLRFPVNIEAATDGPGEPDFYFAWPDGRTLGVEVTEAGAEDYQAWLTRTEGAREIGLGPASPFEPSTPGTASEITKSIEGKVSKFDEGAYRSPDNCDLVVYDNTAWGGFLDKDDLPKAIGRPDHLLGRFRHVHFVTGETVFLDLFGNDFVEVDISKEYEIDYAGWIFDQIESMRQGATAKLDIAHIAEELTDLGKAERRALESHLRNLLLHLLKWEYQPEKRSKSWLLSIKNARREIYDLIEESPSLAGALRAGFTRQYARARELAAVDTGLPTERFPEHCSYERDQVLDPEFLPEINEGKADS